MARDVPRWSTVDAMGPGYGDSGSARTSERDGERRLAVDRQRVVEDYLAQYPDPIRAQCGESVSVVRRDAEYPEWVWCSGPEGREGWVPLILLQRTADGVVLVRDYDARELSVKAGEEVTVHEEIGGWARISTASGRTGWIPARCLTGG